MRSTFSCSYFFIALAMDFEYVTVYTPQIGTVHTRLYLKEIYMSSYILDK